MDLQNLSQQHLSLVLLFSLSLLLLLKQIRKKSTSKLPPGPWKLPIIGNLHQLGAMPHRSLHKLSQKHGPLMLLKLGSIPTLVISSSDILREVVKSHDLAFSSRPPLYAAKKLSYGRSDMAFAPYGEHWRQLRKVSIQELLSLKRVQSFWAVREEEVALLIGSLKRSSSSVNLSEMSQALNNNILCRVIFGDKYAYTSYDEGRSRFHGLLEETMKLLGGFCFTDFFPWLEWIQGFTDLKRMLDKNFEEFDALFDHLIEEHLNKQQHEHDYVESFLDVLLRLQKDSNYGNIFSSTKYIKALIADLFFAGTDTSTAAVVWTMTELMRNPTVMNKVQEELQTVVGDKTHVQESDLEQLEYLKLVIKEALRMHPPAPLLVPRETEGSCSIKGYTIPAKTKVFINAYSIAMDPINWKNPNRFWPERFLSNDTDFRGQAFNLIPFGFGRRSCPGINFSALVVELLLANLLHCFDWKLPSGMVIEDLDTEEVFGLTIHKKNHLHLVPKCK